MATAQAGDGHAPAERKVDLEVDEDGSAAGTA
jgi:hypothetical protein